MNKKIIITAVISLILGIIISVSAYFVYVVIRMQEQVNMNTANNKMIVDFLNKNIQESASQVQMTQTPGKDK